MVDMTKTQKGLVGEELFAAHALITSYGQVELFKPESDDDHDDFAGGRKGKTPALTLQIKTAFELKSRQVHFSVSVPRAGVRESPAFVYVIQYVAALDVPATWVVPSPEWDQVVRITRTRDYGSMFEFRARPAGRDTMSPWRIERAELGSRLLVLIDALPPGTRAPRIAGSHLARRRRRR